MKPPEGLLAEVASESPTSVQVDGPKIRAAILIRGTRRNFLADRREAIQALQVILDEIQAESAQLTAEIVSLKALCPHKWSYKHTGRHGSDKGTEYYECDYCGSSQER